MTKDEYVRLALEGADAEGVVDPPPLTDWWVRMGILMEMYMKGLIERRGPGRMYERTGPWYITELGRAAQEPPGEPSRKDQL